MTYTCPRCGAVSAHPMDKRERYCGRCHLFEEPAGRIPYYDRQGNPVDLWQWAAFIELGGDYKRVAETQVGDVRVSTVWLGIDHNWGDGPPLIFETMIFGGDLNEDCDRYSTEAQALAGHAAMVERVKAS